MIIIPAIDLKDGKCVRLMQGDFGRVTVYADDPVEVALRWQEAGAGRIHIVDLDGARTGTPCHRDVIERVARSVSVPLQVGGGIRDSAAIAAYREAGVRWVIIGTAALEKSGFVFDVCARYPGAVILGIDARDGRVSVKGWREDTGETPVALARRYETSGCAAIVYTDITRDGTGAGVNTAATKLLAESVNIPVIASGGVSGLADIDTLLEIEPAGVIGVIIGRALYNGSLDLAGALQHAARAEMRGRYAEHPHGEKK